MSVTGILNNLDQLTSTSLKHLKIKIDDILRKRRQECNDSYIHHIKNFCSDQTLLDIVLAECEAIFNKSNSKSNKVTTSWLCNENIEYSYSHTNTLKSMKKLSDFPGICRLMDKINFCTVSGTEVSGVMDCCLAMRYSSNRFNLRPRADIENEIIDQDASICSFSLGSSRTIEFFTEEKTPKLVYKHQLNDNSLLIMKPGTQQRMKHAVRVMPSANGVNEIRYVISFRKLVTSPSLIRTTQHPLKSNISAVSFKSDNIVTPKNVNETSIIYRHLPSMYHLY